MFNIRCDYNPVLFDDDRNRFGSIHECDRRIDGQMTATTCAMQCTANATLSGFIRQPVIFTVRGVRAPFSPLITLAVNHTWAGSAVTVTTTHEITLIYSADCVPLSVTLYASLLFSPPVPQCRLYILLMFFNF